MIAPKFRGGSNGCKRDGYAAGGDSGREGGVGGLDLYSTFSVVPFELASVGGMTVRPAVACVMCVASSPTSVMIVSLS